MQFSLFLYVYNKTVVIYTKLKNNSKNKQEMDTDYYKISINPQTNCFFQVNFVIDSDLA